MRGSRAGIIDIANAARRFPRPWTIEEQNDACFIVRDKNRQALAYVYFEEDRVVARAKGRGNNIRLR